MIDPQIPLSVRPFQTPQAPNFIDQYSKLANIKNTQQETELRRQEGIQNAAKAQREQQQYDEGTRKLAGDKALGEQLAQNTSTDQQGQPVTDYQSAAKNLAAAGFGDHARQVLVMGAADQKAKLEDHGKTLDNTKKTVDAIGAALGSLSKIPPDQYAAQRDNKIDELVSQGTLTPQQGQQYKSSTVLAQSQANGGPGDVSVLQQFDQAHLQNALTGQQQIEAQRGDVELGIKVAESKQKLLEGKLKTTQEVTQNTASLLSSATNQAQWEGILRSQVNAGAPQEVISLFGPMYSPAAAQRAGQLATKPSERETARHNVVEEAQGAGRLADEQAKTGIAAKTYEATFGAGANPALVGVEPKLRTGAMKDAQKATDDFATANKAADAMQSMIDLARSGNKAAGSNLPLVGVETLNALNGIKRINKSELDQYQGAGSLLDRIQGRIEKLAVGQPIPTDVMNDIEKMHQTLRQGATKAYNDKLSGINQNYRSNFQPVKGAETGKAQAAKDPLGIR